MLIVLIFMMAGLMIALLATAPSIAQQIKRDREEEMIHRGAQYARAVKKYYKKFGRYPPTLEALEDTNHMRFLRKRYKDPLTPDGKWQLVRFGQVQFNATGRQGGTGGLLGGGTGLPNVPGVTGLLTGQGSQTGQQTNAGGQATQNPQGGSTGTTGATGTTGDTAASGTTGSSSGSGFSLGTGGGFGQSTTGGGNQPLGGGAIIGVASMSNKQSLRLVDDKDHYKDWKFVYDPTFDRPGMLITGPYDPKKQLGQYANQNALGQPAGQPAGQQSIFGNNPGSSFGQPSSSPVQNPSPFQRPTLPPDQNVAPSNPQ